MSYPYNLQTKIVTGRFDDLYEDVHGQVQTRPREGYVYVTPYYDKIKVLDVNVVVDLYELQRQRVKMVDGLFTVELLVTDQPNISPGPSATGGWTYKFEFSWEDNYEINLPITTDLPSVIDINDWFSSPEHPGVLITKGDPGEDGLDGRGIVSITANGNIATVHYTDGSTSTFGLPGGSGGGVYNYEHVQSNPVADWTIHHNMNRNITSTYVLVGTGIGAEQVQVPYSIIDLNTIVIHHGSACSGKAILI